MPSRKIPDLIIIGAGPAGVAAAIQSRIYGLEPLVMEKDEVGGRLSLARRVENFLYTDKSHGEGGLFLAGVMKRRLAAEGIRVIKSEVEEVRWRGGRFWLYDRQGRCYPSGAVILATGTKPQPWRVSMKYEARKHIYPDWRSIPRIKGQEVAVIGGGETAFDQACSLAELGARVCVVIRGQGPKAYPRLVREASSLGVEVIVRSEIVEVSKVDGGIQMTDSRGRKIKCQAVVPSIGWQAHRPRMDGGARRRKGQGLYFAGDVADKRFRQAAIAFGSGLGAAMAVREYLGGGYEDNS